jgi:diacylglycerol kinase (ATP)
MSMKQKIGIILNPVAGRGHAKSTLGRIIKSLRERKITFELELTKGPAHAKDIAARMSKYSETIVAAGGDGTVNEVVSGIVGKRTAIAILSIGSGNDYSKVIGVSKKMDQVIDAIINNKRKLMDLGKVVYWDQNGNKKERYFVNTLGMGLDAEIAKETKRIKYLRGLPLYLLAALKAIKKHHPNNYKITEDKKTKDAQAFLICAGNGCFEGGGFKLLPDARPNDRLLDVCMLGVMPIHKAIKIVPKLINGTHETLQEVSIWKTKRLKIKAKNPFILHGDGEIFEENVVEVDINMAQSKICYISS